MGSELSERLSTADHRALLIVADSSRDPDLAPFVGEVHLGSSFIILAAMSRRRGQAEARLGYLTAMEREEAAATGLALLSPEHLGAQEIRRESQSEAEFLAELLRRALGECGVEPGPVAVAGHAAAGTVVEASARMAAHGWSFVDGRELVLRHRKRKTGAEIAAARHAAEGTCAAFRRVAEILAACESASGDGAKLRLDGAPLTAGRLRDEISIVLAGFGLDQPEGNIVAAGRDAGVPHSQGANDRVLKRGEALIVDLYPKGHVFADCTRTFCVGEPATELREAHLAVRETLTTAHEMTRHGAIAEDLQDATCDAFEARGYATLRSDPETDEGYVHGLGHGVGFQIHEYPSFRKGAGGAGLLETGDLLTLEPGLYFPEHPNGGFGVRLEDFVLLTADGPENLTPLSYELNPTAW